MRQAYRCEYCNRGTDNTPERIGNRRIWVCNRTKCQQEFWDAEIKARDAAQRYDDWVTRSE